MFKKKSSNNNIRKRTTEILPTEDIDAAGSETKFRQGDEDDQTQPQPSFKRHIGQPFGPARSKFARRSQFQTKVQERLHSQHSDVPQEAVPIPPATTSTENDSDAEMFTKEEIAKVRAEKQLMRSKMGEFAAARTNAVTGKHMNTTIMFGVPTTTTTDIAGNARLGGRGTVLADLVGSSSSRDSDGSDSDSWVMEQVSKGTTRQSIEMLKQEYNQNRTSSLSSDILNRPTQVPTRKRGSAAPAPFGALNFRYIKCTTCEEVTKEIDASVQTLSESIRSSEAKVTEYQHDIDETMRDIARSKAQSVEDEKNHAFFCQLNEFVRNLVDFLTEKAPEIEDIEQRLADAQSEHDAFCRSQRSVLVQRAESMAYTPTAPYDPTSKAQADLSDLLTLAESAEASREGARLAETKKRLLDEAEALLSDTTDEYRTIGSVLKPFAQWKGNPSTAASYRQAYCSMVLPMLLSPFVRYEVLAWDPLLQPQKLAEMRWVASVRGFCAGTGVDGEKDPDAELVRALVNSSVLPKVKEAILNGDWSPFVAEQNRAAIQLVKSLGDMGDDTVGEISGDVLAELQDAVEAVRLPGMPGCAAVGSREMLKRLFERAITLYGSVCEWSQVMKDGQSAIQRLAIDNFLNVRLLPYIKTLNPEEAYNVAYTIIMKMPKEWRVKTLPSLKFFIDFITSLIASTKKDLTIHFV